MFYITLWLVMFIGWIALIAWGATMESLDRRRALAAKQAPRITTVEDDNIAQPVPAHA